MITCPWCGTSYSSFLSSCQRCGGPIPPPERAPSAERPEFRPEAPPPPPRTISDSFLWKLLFSDGWAIASAVFVLLGGIFTITGLPLSFAIVTAFVGIPFLGFGLLFLAPGAVILYKRVEHFQTIVKVLREGQSVLGRITSVDMNPGVQVNGRNPWTIGYEYAVLGAAHEGRVTTLNEPGWQLQPGRAAYVLYLSDQPESSALYPHP